MLTWLHAHGVFVNRHEEVLGRTVQVGVDDNTFDEQVPCLLAED